MDISKTRQSCGFQFMDTELFRASNVTLQHDCRRNDDRKGKSSWKSTFYFLVGLWECATSTKLKKMFLFESFSLHFSGKFQKCLFFLSYLLKLWKTLGGLIKNRVESVRKGRVPAQWPCFRVSALLLEGRGFKPQAESYQRL